MPRKAPMDGFIPGAGMERQRRARSGQGRTMRGPDAVDAHPRAQVPSA